MNSESLEQSIKGEARRLGFFLAGVTSPDPPVHLRVFENWLGQGRQASMDYLADERARARRAEPRLILPECKSILVLALPYTNPKTLEASNEVRPHGRSAAYAWGTDYHIIISEKLEALVEFIERRLGHPVPNRWYTDTGPILERDLAQHAGLGWIGKNTCLISPQHGSYFLLAEIFLGLELEPDPPFVTDQCGTCTRCIQACPTQCILPDRTLDAGRCISYLTIELKDDIPAELRPAVGNWIFGCDICQEVCPWNRFAEPEGEPALRAREGIAQPDLIRELELTSEEFKHKFKDSPVQRAKRRGYLRNVAVALGNTGGREVIPALEMAMQDAEPMIREHASWAVQFIQERHAQ